MWWIRVVDRGTMMDSQYAVVGVACACRTHVAGWTEFDRGERIDPVVARCEPAGDSGWEHGLLSWSGGGWEDGATALSLRPGVGGVGANGPAAVIPQYAREPH